MGRNMMSAMKRLIKRKSFDEKAAMPYLIADQKLAAEEDKFHFGSLPATLNVRKEPAQKLSEIEKDKVEPLKQKSAWFAEDLETATLVDRKKLQMRLKKLGETAMRFLEELDAIELSSDTTDEQQYQNNREKRKGMVVEIQALISRFDDFEYKIQNLCDSGDCPINENLENNGPIVACCC